MITFAALALSGGSGALAAIGIAGAGFVAAEFVARAWLARRGRSFVWPPYSQTRMLIDRETLPTLEPVVEHRINSEGERGDPLPPTTNGLFRVLVVGGSAAECWFIDQKSSWANVVQETLREPQNLAKLQASHVHVGNIARSLVTCRHVDAILERVLPHYERLDAIVFMVGASDVLHWLEKGAPSKLDDGPIAPSAIFGQYPDGPFGWGPRTLALRRIASAARRRWSRGVEVRDRAGRRLGDARAMRQRAKEVVREVPDPTPMLAGFDAWFESLILRAREKARHVIVVRQPWLEKQFTPEEEKLLWSFGSGRPYAGEVTRYYAREVGWKLHRMVDQHAETIARKLGVETIDLMPILEPSFDHYYDDHHHTPAGCRVIGRTVAEAIVEAVETKRKPAEKSAGASPTGSPLKSRPAAGGKRATS